MNLGLINFESGKNHHIRVVAISRSEITVCIFCVVLLGNVVP